jgi:PAP2 superfamily
MFTKHWYRAGSKMPRATANRVRPKPACRLRVETMDERCLPSADVVLHWNEILLQSLTSQPPRVPLARNMAIVHVAMFDAVNSIDRSYEPYFADVPASSGASKEAAAAQAAHDTLSALYPSRQAIYDAALSDDLAGIPPGLAKQGIAIGHEVALQILALRANDGASAIVTYTPPNTDPGQWQPTFPDFSPAANAHVPLITPFAVENSSQFRPGPPPALDSVEYATAFNEAKTLGSATGSTRTADQTQVALLWRLPLTNHQVWNRIAQDIAEERGTSIVENARLFALLDMSINDGLETSFGTKYQYTLWRPITAIRRAGEDGNPATEADPNWMTLHPNTPAYPTYSGNAATVGAASATVLAEVFGDNDIPFQVDWSAYNFPGVTRSYAGFSAAAQEEADSRIYGGIHFRFDSVAGQGVGTNVGNYVVDHFLLPRDHDNREFLTAADAAPRQVNQSLNAKRVQPLLNEALARWRAAGIDTSALGKVDVRIADLGGLTLGETADGIIWLDDNAAGWGWFVDRTARNDSEFVKAGNQGEQNRMDLLTVLMHETGHLLGRDHEATGVMQETLTAGTRRNVSPVSVTDPGWLNIDVAGLVSNKPGTGSK